MSKKPAFGGFLKRNSKRISKKKPAVGGESIESKNQRRIYFRGQKVTVNKGMETEARKALLK